MNTDYNLAMEPHLKGIKNSRSQKVSTFDIFDTLLTRKVGDPAAVFLLLGNYLLANNILKHSPEVFAHARVNAETAAHNKPNLPVVNLTQIYKELRYMLKISIETRDKIMALECELEATLLTAVPGASEIVQKAHNSGNKIILISDMYLPSLFINEQIKKNGFTSINSCYVSNEYLKSKRTGELFKVVAKDCGIPSSDFTHFGDNKKSDFDAPQKLNWNAVHYTEIRLSRFEQILNSFMWQTGGFSSAMAGASRLARLSIKHKNKNEKEISRISAGVVAPVLVSYTLWVLHRAKELGLNRLYFVSRDGQIYLKIATILNKKLKLGLQLSYLYGSRKAWHFPSVTNLSEELDWITKKINFLSIKIILERIFTKPEEIKDILSQYGFPEDSWDKGLNIKQIDDIKQVLLQPEVEDLVLKKAKDRRTILYGYFEQEGLTVDDKWAMVDIGWGGNSQNFMGKILKLNGAALPKGFYFALKSKEQGETHGIKEGYLVDRILDVGYAKVLNNIQSLMESFCTADHGTVEGYEYSKENIVPVLGNYKNDKVEEWEINLIQNTVCKFTEYLFLEESYLDPYVHLRPMVVKIIEAFARKPTKSEAQVWGNFQLEENAFEIKFLPLAQPYQFKHLFNIFKNGDPLQHKLSWMEGAMALTPGHMQKVVIFTAKAGRYFRKLLGKVITRTKF